MAVITIPFDYDERTHPTIVPICIADTDSEGNSVHRGWIDLGVVPVVDRFFKIAETVVGRQIPGIRDRRVCGPLTVAYAWRQLWRPAERKVLNSARLYAVDQRAGGRRYRRSLDVELFPETLEALEDQYDFASDIAACDAFDKIVEQVDLLELHRVKEILPFMLNDAEGSELTRVFGQKRNTITKQFYRGMRKAALAAGIKWY